MCPECFRQKMLFETKEQANNFIKWNGDDIDTHGGVLRSYFCPACGGWHITSKPYKKAYDYNTQNLINRYEKDIMLSGSKTVNIDGISDYAKTILESLPKEINSKTKLKAYLTTYFEDNSISDKKVKQDIRGEIYGLIKSGKYAIRTRTVCDKLLSDEEIIKFLGDYTIEDPKQLSHSINKVITKRGIIISKQQRKRIVEFWCKNIFKKDDIEKFEKEHDKEYVINEVFQKLIKEVPNIENPQPKFVRTLVDRFVNVSDNLPSLSSNERNAVKGLALKYYFKNEDEK